MDGQHRLWAQRFSNKDAQYACIIHLNKTEKEMAELFLEINDNQRRVPSSLRWDLVRLVKPEGDEAAIMASELVLALVERQDSPFYIAIDLTGEQKDVSIKQGSPEQEKSPAMALKNMRRCSFGSFLQFAPSTQMDGVTRAAPTTKHECLELSSGSLSISFLRLIRYPDYQPTFSFEDSRRSILRHCRKRRFAPLKVQPV